jgi:hypothetical protein
LAYATVAADIAAALSECRRRNPSAPIFGATSFQGVFCPAGFRAGVHLLCGEESDRVRAHPVMKAWPRNATRDAIRRQAIDAAREIRGRLREPSILLLHTTPGFEEAVLDGIDEGFSGSAPPVYGGSAADDDLSGKWRIFSGTHIVDEGMLVVGIRANDLRGAFVSGYRPTSQTGIITRAEGRVAWEINGAPAARVYDEWIDGRLGPHLGKGGVVLAETTLRPLGRAIDQERYVLSHPHAVTKDDGLSFFTDIARGDLVTLMSAQSDALVTSTEQAARAARGDSRKAVRGGILIYCGGCVAAVRERIDEAAALFARSIGGAPFIGAATWGEQGCFQGRKNVNVHGNLMCDALLFG